MNLVSERGDRGRIAATASALIAIALMALAAFASRAQAAEVVFWDNYDAVPPSVSFAGIDGSGGGSLNLAGAPIGNPEGMAYDSVTNRMFVASSATGATGEIVAINLDGSGASVFNPPGAVIASPEGVAIDPVRRLIFWANDKTEGSIGWANLDGSAAGVLNTTGVSVESPYRLAVDPVNGKVYWNNSESNPDVIAFANADNTGGGGTLDLTGAVPPTSIRGLAVDPAGNRIYWLESNRVGFASLSGGGGGEVNIAGATFSNPYGIAFDPSLGRLYWGNYGAGTERANAIGFANIAGGVGGITPATAPVDGPQDPVILKSPTGTGAPTLTRGAKAARAKLACTEGSWAADFAGSFVYQAPRSFAFQWTRNGAAVAGATASTFTAKSPGTYACTVTATNQTGSASQTSGTVVVKAAKAKLTTKRKAKAHPGGVAIFKVKIVNKGDLASKKSVKLCAKVPKKARADIKAPKCKNLGKLKAQSKRTTRLRFEVGPDASGVYKVTFRARGIAGKAVKAKIVVAE
jgi:phage FluMu protein Com